MAPHQGLTPGSSPYVRNILKQSGDPAFPTSLMTTYRRLTTSDTQALALDALGTLPADAIREVLQAAEALLRPGRSSNMPDTEGRSR